MRLIKLLIVTLSFFQLHGDQANTLKEQLIYETVPEGILIQKCEYGYGLYASKSYKAGEILYKHRYFLIDDEERDFTIITNQGDLTICTTTHTVIMGNGKRALYTFDSLINHSCDPNTYSWADQKMTEACEYCQIAIRDIKEGEELNCDYNLFDYDCRDKGIIECHCGSINCRKAINGFKWLPLSEQLELLPKVDISIQKQFYDDHPEFN